MSLDRKKMASMIWLELKKNYKGGTDEATAVRMMREDACRTITERTRPGGMAESDYANLSDDELWKVYRLIRFQEMPLFQFPLKEFASAAQTKKLRWAAMECALESFDFRGVSYTIDNARTISGVELANYAKMLWRGHRLSGSLYSLIHTKWIHPIMHRWLFEGCLRYENRMPKNPEYFHWPDLQMDEAQYLIERFEAMYNTQVKTGRRDKRTHPSLN